MTQTQQIVKLIESVIRKKHEFGPYSLEDLRQECMVHILEKSLPKYDDAKPLENYIRRCCKYWYINFRRDNFARPGMPQELFDKKRSLAEPVDIDLLGEDITTLAVEYDFIDQIDSDEVWALADKFLPTNLRHDFLRLKTGSRLISYRKFAVIAALREIMIEHGMIAQDGEV